MISSKSSVTNFTLTWGGLIDDWGSSIALDSANKVCIVGSTESHGVGKNDAFVVKFNSECIKDWNLTWGVLGNDERIIIIKEYNFKRRYRSEKSEN